MEISGELKRRHSVEDSGDKIFPETKRLKAEDIFINILDDDDDAGDQDVASVMRSLEAEIGGVSPPPASEEPATEQPDLGFLFEASDDELGLPPAIDAISAPDLGQIWGFEEIGGFEGFELASSVGGSAGEEAAGFDGGLFDFADEICGGAATDFADVSWRSESLPAV